jgi:hypothetical protein
MPTSCADLERMGQQVNGFFLVKGSKKMEMIYCNFFANQNGTTWCAIFACYCLSNWFCFQTNRNGLDTPTSNRRPSISTSREIPILKHNQLQFRSIWPWWTRETPWICGRGNSRHRDREFIFSLSRERCILNLHRFILIFIWTGIQSGRVMFTSITLINTVRCLSSGRWTWKKAINSG